MCLAFLICLPSPALPRPPWHRLSQAPPLLGSAGFVRIRLLLPEFSPRAVSPSLVNSTFSSSLSSSELSSPGLLEYWRQHCRMHSQAFGAAVSLSGCPLRLLLSGAGQHYVCSMPFNLCNSGSTLPMSAHGDQLCWCPLDVARPLSTGLSSFVAQRLRPTRSLDLHSRCLNGAE
eukprot:3932872-Rhodomonas_salina.2